MCEIGKPPDLAKDRAPSLRAVGKVREGAGPRILAPVIRNVGLANYPGHLKLEDTTNAKIWRAKAAGVDVGRSRLALGADTMPTKPLELIVLFPVQYFIEKCIVRITVVPQVLTR